MAIESSVEVFEDYILLTSKGERNDFIAVIEGTTKIYEAAKKLGSKYVLADYRQVTFNVPIADAFNLVKVYEKKMPLFNEIILYVVVNKDNLEISKFWESVCNRRGYSYKIFTDFDEAKESLMNIINENSTTP